ncbi:MAG: hypothetical protein DMF64_17970 [Acidobacteria bacterium]|nr:MAG: hypothetical protein DMF64_17970 [Acidobacteriota bacterium]
MVVAFEDQLDKACFSDSNLILPFHRRFITKAEACARLNVSQSWLESLIAQGRLETFRRGPSEAECLIDAESIDQFKAEIRFFIPAVEAAELLKIDVYDIYDLVRHGCLKPQSGPTVDGSIEWRFDMEELIDLLMRVFEKTSATMSTVKNREMMDTRDVFQYLNAHQLSVGRFMHSVFDGEVTPQALQPRRGLLHFLFLRKQIVDYKRRFCPMKEHSPVSVNDASDGKHYSDKAGDRYKDASSTKQTNEDMKRLSVIVIFLETQWELNDRIYTNNTNKRIVPYEANQLTYSMKLFICSVSDSAS